MFPRSVIIEPTNACNLHCSYCPRRYATSSIGFMSFDLYTRLIDEIHGKAESLILFHRGESMLHKQFSDMLKYASGKVERVMVTTNGTLLNHEMSLLLAKHVDFVSFSIDTEVGLLKHRGANYHKVMVNIGRFLLMNHRAETQVSMVRTEDVTEEQASEFTEMWRELVDRVRIYEEHSKGGKFGALLHKRPLRMTCAKVYNQIAISWDGSVRRCNHDWDGIPLGNVTKESITDVWNGESYQSLRKQHETLQIVDATCKSCDSWYESNEEAGTGELVKGENSIAN